MMSPHRAPARLGSRLAAQFVPPRCIHVVGNICGAGEEEGNARATSDRRRRNLRDRQRHIGIGRVVPLDAARRRADGDVLDDRRPGQRRVGVFPGLHEVVPRKRSCSSVRARLTARARAGRRREGALRPLGARSAGSQEFSGRGPRAFGRPRRGRGRRRLLGRGRRRSERRRRRGRHRGQGPLQRGDVRAPSRVLGKPPRGT